MQHFLKSSQHRQFIAPLVRYRFLILTFCLSATLSSLALTYVISEKYVASAIVLFQPYENVSFQQKSRDALGFPLPLVPLETIANTVEDIAKSEAVLEATVRTLHLDVTKKKHVNNPIVAAFLDAKDRVKELRSEAWQILQFGRILPKDDFRGAMIELRKNLNIRRTNKAYTFRLEATDGDPERSALIVNTVGDIVSQLVSRDRARTAREAKLNLETRVTQASAELEMLRTAMDTLKRNTNVASLQQELSLHLKSANAFEEDLSKASTQVQSLERQRIAIGSQLEKQEPSIRYSSTVAENPIYNELRSELSKLGVERSGLLMKFTPDHPEVKVVDAKLAEARSSLQKESPKIVSSESSKLNDLHQKLFSDKLAVEAELEAARARVAGLKQAVDSQQQLARLVTRSEPKIEDIALRLATAEKSYQLVSEAYQEAALTESKTVRELSLQSPALVPGEPARPLKILHVTATLVTSLALSIGLVIGISFFDLTIRSIAEAESALGLPVFGTIPLLPPGSRGEMIVRPKP
jgi:succinoglycan biosynthesis transport protein ExoP